GVDLVGLACRVALGARLAELGAEVPELNAVAVKEAVLPFARFPGSDPVLGPEMRSTGEVMALAPDFPTAYAKASRAAGLPLPSAGDGRPKLAFLSVCDRDKSAVTLLAQRLSDLGFELCATPGTARAIGRLGIPVTRVSKIGDEDGEETIAHLIRDQ